mmetsp:Transcript_62345/g.180745  ORF Transcript_62345/g.180745 Transcript_62345/m.180745 type:complete len:246 (+) Transcript_62345:520-1257(+)
MAALPWSLARRQSRRCCRHTNFGREGQRLRICAVDRLWQRWGRHSLHSGGVARLAVPLQEEAGPEVRRRHKRGIRAHPSHCHADAALAATVGHQISGPDQERHMVGQQRRGLQREAHWAAEAQQEHGFLGPLRGSVSGQAVGRRPQCETRAGVDEETAVRARGTPASRPPRGTIGARVHDRHSGNPVCESLGQAQAHPDPAWHLRPVARCDFQAAERPAAVDAHLPTWFGQFCIGELCRPPTLLF